MYKIYVALIVIFPGAFPTLSHAQSGCTDVQATNYNASAVSNDGSCIYPSSSISLTNRREFPTSLNENSGLIITDGNMWTFNDGGNAAAIYRIDTTNGAILQTVTISNATNTDWEAITADDQYIYIGDFGNNVNGNRTNLRVYRVAKADILSSNNVSVSAEVINFSYQDQVIQNPVTTPVNSTRYDCEAFIIRNNVLHLFTKNWIDATTTHYTLSSAPGTHVAVPVEVLDVDGLITDAALSASNPNQIVLIGYSTDYTTLFMWLLYDFNGDEYFTGNKRRFNLPGPLSGGQIEGVTFRTATQGYISGERVEQTVAGFPITVTARFHSFSTAAFVTLPVSLSQFSAQANTSTIDLIWTTIAETNNAHFIMEHSTDGLRFEGIGKIAGRGNTATATKYSFAHLHPSAGANYYRLRQVDIDGTETLFKTLLVQMQASTSPMLVYPNPVTGRRIRIQTNFSVEGALHYILYDFTGRKRMEGRISASDPSIDIASIDRGLYFIQLSNGQMGRIVK